MAYESHGFLEAEWGKDADGETYTLTYLVRSSSANEDPYNLYIGVNILKGDTLAFDPTLVCNRVGYRNQGIRADGGSQWNGSYTYGKAKRDTSTVQETIQDPTVTNPLEYIAEISTSINRVTEGIDKDTKGTLWGTTAKDPFDSLYQKETGRTLFRFTKNLPAAGFDPEIATQWVDSVNSDPFMGCEPGCVRFLGMTSTLQKDTEIGFFFKCDYEFETSKKPQNPIKASNKGFNKRNGEGKLEEMLDPTTNQPYAKAVFLNQEGTGPHTGEGGTYVDFYPYEEKEFGPVFSFLLVGGPWEGTV